ncbi:hypothetical protein HPB50_027608 [Hyalomma asiaticum]|nr:hypothetical protein HPB50_027608 [Hyalomma asiaticum]
MPEDMVRLLQGLYDDTQAVIQWGSMTTPQIQALWAFSRYEMTMELWKSVAVPALTFGNAVLCLSSTTRQALNVR